MEEHEAVVDSYTLDCADFFLARILRDFPYIQSEMTFPVAWRPSWDFTVSPDTKVRDLRELCNMLQDRIFWDQGVLIGYTIEVEEYDEDEYTADDSSGL